MSVARLVLTIPEVGEALGIDRATVYRLLRRGDLPLPLVHLGSSVRVRVADLERYLEQLAANESPTAGSAARRRPAGATRTKDPGAR